MGKFLNQKTARWVMIGCAGFIALYNIIASIGGDSFGTFGSLIWALAAMGLIIYGLLASKENFVKCGLFASLAFVLNAFVMGCSCLGTVGDAFEFSGCLGLTYLFWALASLCVATLFVFWLLKTFFGIEVNKFVSEIIAYCAVGLYFLALLFIVITSMAEEYFTVEFVDVIVYLCYIAYIGLFMAYLYKDEPAKASQKKAVETKAEPAKAEEPVKESAEEPDVKAED